MATVEQACVLLDDRWRPIGVANSPAHPDSWGSERTLYIGAQLAIASSFREGLGTEVSPAHPDGFGHETAGLVHAHLATGNPDRAMVEFDRYIASVYPSGFSGHYVLGPHKRLGMETNFIDAFVQRAIKLPNGERVSPLAAPPNWAIAAEAIAGHLEETGVNAKDWVAEHFDLLCRSTLALYRERGQSDGMLVQLHQDELTLRDGRLRDLSVATAKQAGGKQGPVGQNLGSIRQVLYADSENAADKERLSKDPRQGRLGRNMKYAPMIDVGINALNVANNRALQRLAERYKLVIPESLADLATRSELSWAKICEHDVRYYRLPSSRILDSDILPGSSEDGTGRPVPMEGLLAIARARPYLQSAPAQRRVYETLTAVTEAFPFGIPTHAYISKAGRLTAQNQHDQGTISPSLTLELAALLAQSEQARFRELGHEIGRNTLRSLQNAPENHFPRTLDPNSGESNQAGPVTRRVKSRRPDWMPTAAAMVATARVFET